MSHLRLEYKLRIAVVLCLSVICIILSIVRLAGGIQRNVFGKQQFGIVWISFMLHCEAAVAVLTGSAPALRAIYTSHQNRKSGFVSDSETLKTLRSKTRSVLGSVRRKKGGLPMQERPKASIARWRHSLVGIIPRRISNRIPPVPKVSEYRKDSAESAIIHPGLAYHDFRKQEKNHITVTQETTVSCSEKSLMSEVSSQCIIWALLVANGVGDIRYRYSNFGSKFTGTFQRLRIPRASSIKSKS